MKLAIAALLLSACAADPVLTTQRVLTTTAISVAMAPDVIDAADAACEETARTLLRSGRGACAVGVHDTCKLASSKAIMVVKDGRKLLQQAEPALKQFEAGVKVVDGKDVLGWATLLINFGVDLAKAVSSLQIVQGGK